MTDFIRPADGLNPPIPHDDQSDPTTMLLHSTTDARVWAQEWCRIARTIAAKDGPESLIDEGWMIGWFANAMMCAIDHDRRAQSGRSVTTQAAAYPKEI